MEELRVRQGTLGELVIKGSDGRMEWLDFDVTGLNSDGVEAKVTLPLDRSNAALVYRFLERWLGSI